MERGLVRSGKYSRRSRYSSSTSLLCARNKLCCHILSFIQIMDQKNYTCTSIPHPDEGQTPLDSYILRSFSHHTKISTNLPIFLQSLRFLHILQLPPLPHRPRNLIPLPRPQFLEPVHNTLPIPLRQFLTHLPFPR